MSSSKGSLVLCATPIGNLEDMSPRAVETLRRADILACEDTRRTRKLLTHFGIEVPQLAVYNEGNETRQAESLVKMVAAGRRVVLVSDAGVPGLSDPGYRLVTACVERGLPVEVVPGPNAAVSALSIAGIAPGRFVFEGFLPRRSSERKRHLEEMVEEPRTLVFYESPHRIAASLADMHEVLGDRRAAIARELTKMYEEVLRGTLSELIDRIRKEPVRGEIVVVVEGATRPQVADVTPEGLAEAARRLMEEGTPRSDALHEVARTYGVKKREVFDALLAGRDKDLP